MGIISKKSIQPREFTFRPQFYDPNTESSEEEGKRRIKFQRILRQPAPQKKPVTRYLVYVVLILGLFWYMKSQLSKRPIQVESIRVEDIN